MREQNRLGWYMLGLAVVLWGFVFGIHFRDPEPCDPCDNCPFGIEWCKDPADRDGDGDRECVCVV
jgi:hypothetical protein